MLRNKILIVFSGTLLCLFFVACSQKGDPSVAQRAAATQPKAVAPIDPANTASVSGTVHFSGAVPKMQKIDMSMDPGCRGENHVETYVVNDGNLANVVVYVKSGLEGGFTYAGTPVTIDQKGCRYLPHVAAVVVNQQVQFTNGDTATHNIHSSPQINAKWNESQMPTSPTITKTFSNAEMMIPIQCNQHPWMKMYLNVMSNPWFAVTDEAGHFDIKGLPPGDYTLAAVHEKLGEQTLQVHVASKEAKSGADFTFAAQ